MAGIKFMRLCWAAVSASLTKIISSSCRSLNSVFGCSASSFHDKLCVIRNVFSSHHLLRYILQQLG